MMAALPHERFPHHFLRRGGCTFLALQGVTIDEIRVRGDWSSDAGYKYISHPLSEHIVMDIWVATTLGVGIS